MYPSTYFVLLAIVNLSFTCSSSEGHTYDPDGWIAASKYLREALDDSVDPCEDFYGYVCNRWNESFGREGIHGELQRTKQEVTDRLIVSLKEMNLADDGLENFKVSLKSFYDQCMAKPYADDEALIRDIYKNLDKYFLPNIMVQDDNGTDIYPWQLEDNDNFWKYVGRLQREQSTKFMISAVVDTASVNCTEKPLLHLSPQLSSLHRATLNILFQKIIGEYHNITISEEDLNDTAVAIFAYEKDLLELHRHTSTEGRQVKVSELSTIVPQISWHAYFEGLLPDDIRTKWLESDPEVVLDDEEFFLKLNNVIKKYDRVTAYNFGYALVVQRYYDLFKSAQFDTEDNRDYFAGTKQQENICLDLAFRYFSSATARLLFDVYHVNIDEWKTDINLIAESVFSAFRYMVSSLDWLDAEDKAHIIEKINAIKFKHDIPEWIKRDETVEGRTPMYNFSQSLVANDILTQKKLFKQQLLPLMTGVIQDSPPNFLVNAYYWQLKIRLLLGILLPPFYSNSYPLAVKYGSIGFVIGHELLHGFDEGRINERPPGSNGWLKESTMKLFNRKKQCLIQQYSQYCYEEHNACISGQRTINDNIADVEGLKIAFMAYKFASQTMGSEPLLDDLVDHTADQIFFISLARGWCGNEMKTAFYLERDEHSPPKARIERSLSNFRAFAKTFNCPMGSKYVPIKTCSLWGNFWEPS